MAGTGMPASLALEEFGALVNEVFGVTACYHVGSSLRGKQWRDVDVRVILEDDAYAAWGLGDPQRQHHNGKWVGLVRAFSALGTQMTGLPIDFQIQQQTAASEEYAAEGSSALGIVTQLRWQKRLAPDAEPAP